MGNATYDAAETYAQYGEDQLAWDFFGEKTDGVFIEVGAHHPKSLSNTWLLEKRGWSGYLVEPNPALAQALVDGRPNSRVFNCAAGAPNDPDEAWLVIPDGLLAEAELAFEQPADADAPRVPIRTIDSMLEEAGVQRLDYFSIDIEGHEIPALQGFDIGKYRPRLISIEDHVHNHERHRFFKSRGYQLVDRTGCNSWYMPKGEAYPARQRTSHLELFRKYYLGLPLRRVRRLWRK